MMFVEFGYIVRIENIPIVMFTMISAHVCASIHAKRASVCLSFILIYF